jgi:tellurite resistance protein TerC
VGALVADASATRFADIQVPVWAWLATLGFIAVLLLFDILVLHRVPKVLATRRAALETLMWVVIGVAFGAVIVVSFGGRAGGEYFSGYLIEYSLSIDNVFVWALIFTYFLVPALYQHRVLFWGIFGALVLRAIFIFTGVALIRRFEWVLYIFGAFLLYTAYKLLRGGADDMNPEENVAYRAVKKLVPTTPDLRGQHLFATENGRRLATPLFAVLILVETTDVLFAVDSVPAVLAVSREQFIVFTSNAFAILGLRALYFLLADLHARFTYLQQGLAVILAFVGIKMITAHWYEIPGGVSLVVIALVLVASVVASLRLAPAVATVDQIDLVDREEPPPPQER